MLGLADLATAGLRLVDPELAHRLTITALKFGIMPSYDEVDSPILATRLFGRSLSNPIGLAAGFDKNAEVVDALFRLGLGFVECGSITPKPQLGNPKPRLFRLSVDDAVINRMGFNNDGLDAAAARLAARETWTGLVGVNLGANKDSDDRIADYVTGLKRVSALAGYVVVNISSPNTPGLRNLQHKDELERLLRALTQARDEIGQGVPLALKIAPDLAQADEGDIADLVLAYKLDGVIVSNTTITRPADLRSYFRREAGGLSGKPLFRPSTAVLARMRALTRGQVTLIGVGGVSSCAEAYAKIKAGASAIQLYSALVYQGPGLIARIKRGLAERLKADGYDHVAEAVGTDLSPAQWGS